MYNLNTYMEDRCHAASSRGRQQPDVPEDSGRGKGAADACGGAKAVIDQADHVQLSERDSLRVLDLLENPPAPNAKMLAAARALPKRR